jgi:glycosyltransferase involved in cell wall biosynthesis
MLSPARKLARQHRIDDVVEFVGFVRDRALLVDILSSCDVCISPEPMNPLNDQSTLIKIAEYMAVGKPIVAFDLSETRVTAGEAAVYAHTIEEFASAIAELLEDPERRGRMGRLGRERVLESLTWAASERSLLAAYDRALERVSAR